MNKKWKLQWEWEYHSPVQMVKKKLNKLQIDYKSRTIEGCLRQVKNFQGSNELQLINFWTVILSPKDSKPLLNWIREHIDDPFQLVFLKRIRRRDDGRLQVLICTEDYIKGSELSQRMEGLVYEDLILFPVPQHSPSSKELSVKWSHHWPMIWKGDPNDQILNAVEIDVVQTKSYLNQIAEESMKTGKITTLMVNENSQAQAITQDCRDEHPLKHSIMKAIEDLAKMEQQRRLTDPTSEQNYLCVNFHVYTTHEPCTMCCMALIHSRVSRLVYLNRMDKTGGLNPESGDGYVIHDHKLLNSKFEVFEWCGDAVITCQVDQRINA